MGARVVRHQTYKKFLDSANFPNGNLNENSLEEVRSVFEISRVSNLTRESCTFELSTPVHADNAVVPARIMLASSCCWNYRGDGCGLQVGQLLQSLMLKQTSWRTTNVVRQFKGVVQGLVLRQYFHLEASLPQINLGKL